MTTKTIREKLKTYIDSADTKKIEAIYTIVEDDIESMSLHEEMGDAFFDELEERSSDFKNGTAKFYTEFHFKIASAFIQ